MRLRAFVIAGLWVSCTEPPPPPPVVVPKTVALPSSPPPAVKEKEVELPPPPPEAIAAFPDEVSLSTEVSTEKQLLQLLLIDPAKAEAALQKLEAPDAWQVSIIAQFALTRGEKSFELEGEQELPQPAVESALLEGPGPAWVSMDAAPLLREGKKSATLAVLPVNTKVEVTAHEGEWASVSVPVAQVAVYPETGSEPSRVSSTPLAGRVKARQLSPRPFELEQLVKSALSQDDTEEGRLRAVATWLLAWRVERSERTREGLLRAAWAARRASTVVRAALAKNLAPASGLRFAWACTSDDPAAAPWLELSKARPKTLPASVCVSGLDARERCADDSPAALKRAAATKEWLEAVKLAPRPWLRFTVDARDPRQVLVVTTPLEVADPCSEFEEVTFEAASGQVRRLALPLGTKAMTVWVPVSRHAGAEFSIPSTSSERQAVSWLRARGRYRWTVGGKGDLQPSLGLNARAFDVTEDVAATSFALAPERDCSCQ